MTTLNDLFEEYLRRIEPTPTAVGRAKRAHEPLRDDLKKDDYYGSFVAKTILSGSYGRSTAILSIKDVDVIIQTTFTLYNLVDEAQETESPQHCLLRLTQEAIKRTGRSARTKQNRRSIQVDLPAEINDTGDDLPELTLDIVPVLITNGEDTDPMTIADKELVQWCDTFPISQLADSETRNQASAFIRSRHSYKPLVKLLKAWKKVHYASRKTPKGFVLECMTARFHNPQAVTWGEAVHDLFANVCAAWPDPDGLLDVPMVHDISNQSSVEIPIAKTLDEAKGVLRRFHDHLTLMEQALEEAKTNLTKSARIWRLVLGQDCADLCFPLPDDLEESAGSSSGPSALTARQARRDIREAPRFG